MDLKRLDKEEAKKLKTKFNNYRKVISWKEVLNSLENNKRLSVGAFPAKRGEQRRGAPRELNRTHADSSHPVSSTGRGGPHAGQVDSKTIKQTFNKIWLGMPRGNSISDHITAPALKNISLRNQPSHNEVIPKGLKVELKGRLRGAAKSKKLSKIRGSVKSQSIDWNIEYNKKEIYTKWGILGLKIWLVK